MSANVQLQQRSVPRSRWTIAARWSTAIAITWLIIMVVWTWLDNRGEPWLQAALWIECGMPILLTGSSLFAWLGRGIWRRIGWGMLGVCLLIMLMHVILGALDYWSASR